MQGHPALKTERLALQPLALSHAEELFGVYGHSEAMRFWAEPPHIGPVVTRRMIERFMAGSETTWTLFLADGGPAIGNLYYLGNPGPPGMGYILHPDYWRRSLMSEAVKAALAHGFGPMGLDRVELWIDSRNIASQGIARHCGFTMRGRFHQKYNHDAAPHEKFVYGLLASEWRGERLSTGSLIDGMEPILPVRDVKAAAEWYRDMLGFHIAFLYGAPPTHGGVAHSAWSGSGSRLQLTKADVPAVAAAIYFNTGAIEPLYSDIQSRGVSIERPLAFMPWGMREFAVRDLDGYLIRFGVGG